VGDTQAFADLYDATSSRMYSLVLRQFPVDQADDILTSIYLDLWRSAWTYGPESGHALSWLISRAQHGLPQPPLFPPAAVATSRAGDGREQARQRLTRCPSPNPALTRAQQEALVLVYLGRYTLREAGQLLEIPKGAVAAALRDGLLRLRTGLPAAS
jgi:RNA polymerase sigma-70 factor (ECF subfamily)